jgi:hypothetical protein
MSELPLAVRRRATDARWPSLSWTIAVTAAAVITASVDLDYGSTGVVTFVLAGRSGRRRSSA